MATISSLPPKPMNDDNLQRPTNSWLRQVYSWIKKITWPDVSQTASFTASQSYFYPVDATSGSITVTLPLASTMLGKQYMIKKMDASANTVVVVRTGSDTIDGATSVTLTNQYNSLTVISDGISKWNLETNGSSGGGGSSVSVTAVEPITVTPSPGTGTMVITHDTTAVTPGTYGAGTKIPEFTVEDEGHLTFAGEREQCACLTEVAPSLIFQFPSNNVLQFLTDNRNVAEQRVVISAILGNATTVLYGGGYSGDGNGCGVYNAVDDKIYFLSRKYDTVVAGVIQTTTWKNMLVQWDPRTQLITNEMELPAGWCVQNGRNGAGVTLCPANPLVATLVDVTDHVAWLFNATDNTIKGFELSGFTEIFTSTPGDGGLTDNYFTGLGLISTQSMQLALLNNATSDFELIQITGPLTSNYTSVRTLLAAADNPNISEDCNLRRFWLPSSNLLGLYGIASGAIAVIVDVASNAKFFVHSGTHSVSRTWWDTLTNRFYGNDGPGGVLEITSYGQITGLYGSTGDWDTGVPLGGTVFMWSLTFDGGSEFLQGDTANANIPFANYETSSWNAAPETWVNGDINASVFVLRRFLPVIIILPTAGVVGGAGVPLEGAVVLPWGQHF